MWDMARTKVSPGALYAILSGELRARRLTPCVCRMPLPFHIDRMHDGYANWRIGTPQECRRGCEDLIVEIVAQLRPLYDLLESIPEKSEE